MFHLKKIQVHEMSGVSRSSVTIARHILLNSHLILSDPFSFEILTVLLR